MSFVYKNEQRGDVLREPAVILEYNTKLYNYVNEKILLYCGSRIHQI